MRVVRRRGKGEGGKEEGRVRMVRRRGKVEAKRRKNITCCNLGMQTHTFGLHV